MRFSVQKLHNYQALRRCKNSHAICVILLPIKGYLIRFVKQIPQRTAIVVRSLTLSWSFTVIFWCHQPHSSTFYTRDLSCSKRNVACLLIFSCYSMVPTYNKCATPFDVCQGLTTYIYKIISNKSIAKTALIKKCYRSILTPLIFTWLWHSGLYFCFFLLFKVFYVYVNKCIYSHISFSNLMAEVSKD